MKEQRPRTVTTDDVKLVAYVILAILAAASLDAITDAFADFMTR